MSQIETLLSEAKKAISAGEKNKATALLIKAIMDDENDRRPWLLLYAISGTTMDFNEFKTSVKNEIKAHSIPAPAPVESKTPEKPQNEPARVPQNQGSSTPVFRFCPKCGKPTNIEHPKFCMYCGTKLDPNLLGNSQSSREIPVRNVQREPLNNTPRAEQQPRSMNVGKRKHPVRNFLIILLSLLFLIVVIPISLNLMDQSKAPDPLLGTWLDESGESTLEFVEGGLAIIKEYGETKFARYEIKDDMILIYYPENPDSNPVHFSIDGDTLSINDYLFTRLEPETQSSNNSIFSAKQHYLPNGLTPGLWLMRLYQENNGFLVFKDQEECLFLVSAYRNPDPITCTLSGTNYLHVAGTDIFSSMDDSLDIMVNDYSNDTVNGKITTPSHNELETIELIKIVDDTSTENLSSEIQGTWCTNPNQELHYIFGADGSFTTYYLLEQKQEYYTEGTYQVFGDYLYIDFSGEDSEDAYLRKNVSLGEVMLLSQVDEQDEYSGVLFARCDSRIWESLLSNQ